MSVRDATTTTASVTRTSLFEPDFIPTSDFTAMARKSTIVGEFQVVRVERGETYRNSFDDRAALAVAIVRIVDAYTAGASAQELRLAVGSWLSNPAVAGQSEVLDSSGWTFGAGDRFVGGIKAIRFKDTYGFANPDTYFVLDGDRLAPGLAEARSRIRPATGIVAAASSMSAEQLRQACRRGVAAAGKSAEQHD